MKNQNMHRRKFIKFASQATLGTMAAPLFSGCQSPAATVKRPGDKLQVACIGLGNQMHSVTSEVINFHQQIVAVCDVDHNRVDSFRKNFGAATAKARGYTDFHQLLENEKSVDAVVIATPDHWHAAVCKAAIRAGKHVYCEKPLTHTVAEARAIATLARRSRVVTQTGNQGSGSSSFRRSIELIQYGVLGPVTDIYIWHPPHAWPSGVDRPLGEDPIPRGFDWNSWVGPSPLRPYKNDMYHPVNWRGWYDFGGGSLSDFCCHSFSMPVKALNLDYPRRIEVSGVGLAKDSFPKSCTIHFHFPARDARGPVSIHFFTGGVMPDSAITAGMAATFNQIPRTGCILQGGKGMLSAGLWNNECYLKMNGETEYTPAAIHDAAKNVPVSAPRAPQDRHVLEWIDACKGKGKTFSPFEFGGHVTEIGASGLIALRLGRDIDWDGAAMKADGAPEAAALVKAQHRGKFGI